MAKSKTSKKSTKIGEGDIKGRIPEQLWAMNQVSMCSTPSIKKLKKRDRKNAKLSIQRGEW